MDECKLIGTIDVNGVAVKVQCNAGGDPATHTHHFEASFANARAHARHNIFEE